MRISNPSPEARSKTSLYRNPLRSMHIVDLKHNHFNWIREGRDWNEYTLTEGKRRRKFCMSRNMRGLAGKIQGHKYLSWPVALAGDVLLKWPVLGVFCINCIFQVHPGVLCIFQVGKRWENKGKVNPQRPPPRQVSYKLILGEFLDRLPAALSRWGGP